MGRRLHVLLLAMMAAQCLQVSALFEWLRRQEAPPAAPAAPAPLTTEARFEMVTADEKFLAEAKQLELSPLDSCHYRVIARLKASCDGLPEEELAKLGVLLFNCQAEIEGRRTFDCTEEMSLRACTADMDSDTWNAYHIVSNRARSVCYATRQQLFRHRAEHTVNTLISTATSQLAAMKELKEGQLELRELTADSLERLLQGHGDLQARQQQLQDGQVTMESSLKDNLERLGQEKALIASGQELVARLIQGITSRMEMVQENLQIQGSEVQSSHRAIVHDLADVRHQAQDIHRKIDDSMSEFLQYQDQTSQYYADLMGKLERVNSTLGVTLHFLDSMQRGMEERLRMIQGYLGWAGVSLTATWTCIAHTSYFVLFAVLQSFLRCPVFSRALLLLTVPLNAVAEVNQQPALDLASLSLLLLVLSLAHWFVSQLWSCFRFRAKIAASLPPCDTVNPRKPDRSGNAFPLSSTPQKEESDIFTKDNLLHQDTFISGAPGMLASSPRHRRSIPAETHDHSTPKLIRRPLLLATPIDEIPPRDRASAFDVGIETRDSATDSRSARLTLSVNSSLSSRQLCNATTKTGKACKKRAVLGQEYCRVHEGGQTSYNLPL